MCNTKNYKVRRTPPGGLVVQNVKEGGIELIERFDASEVKMWGEIDVALREEAGAALANALDRDKPVVIDTADVTFMDSTGIAFLVQFYTIGAQEGLNVKLRKPPAVVSDVLQMLGIDEMLAPDMLDSEELMATPA